MKLKVLRSNKTLLLENNCLSDNKTPLLEPKNLNQRGTFLGGVQVRFLLNAFSPNLQISFGCFFHEKKTLGEDRMDERLFRYHAVQIYHDTIKNTPTSHNLVFFFPYSKSKSEPLNKYQWKQ